MIDPISSFTAGTCAASFLIDPFIDSRTEIPVVFATQDNRIFSDLPEVQESSGVVWVEPSMIEITAKQANLDLYYPSDEERRVLREALEASSERISEGFLAE